MVKDHETADCITFFIYRVYTACYSTYQLSITDILRSGPIKLLFDCAARRSPRPLQWIGIYVNIWERIYKGHHFYQNHFQFHNNGNQEPWWCWQMPPLSKKFKPPLVHNCTIFLCSLDVRNIVQGGNPLYAGFFSWLAVHCSGPTCGPETRA